MYMHILNIRLCSNNAIKSHLQCIVLFVGNIRIAKYSSTYNMIPFAHIIKKKSYIMIVINHHYKVYLKVLHLLVSY